MKAINLKGKQSKFSKTWHPHQIATVDNMQVLLAKAQGEFIWHSHKDEDELFQVIKGTLYIEFKEHTAEIKAGEIIVVPKGVEHKPYTKNNEIVEILLFEKTTTKHTGDLKSNFTQSNYPKI